MSDEKKKWDFDNLEKWLICISVLLIVFTFLAPIIFTQGTFGVEFGEKTGQIGDTIGGVMNPFITLVGVLVTFLAFYIQYKANKAQTEQFEEQAKQLKKQELDKHAEEVERRFYEMLKIHRDNVNEIHVRIRTREGNINSGYYIDIRIIQGRECFEYLYNELKLYNEYLEKYLSYENILDVDKAEKMRIVYEVFYWGIANYREYIELRHSSTPLKDLMKDIIESLGYAYKYNKGFPDYLGFMFYGKIKKEEKEIPRAKEGRKFEEISFGEGYSSKLGHYYRHLFQTVKYIAEQNKEIINQSKKEDYLKTLRAQLSDYEQLMLYYNAVSGFGEEWIENKYFTDYKMIKNMPVPLANFGIEPKDKFTEDELNNMFDWFK